MWPVKWPLSGLVTYLGVSQGHWVIDDVSLLHVLHPLAGRQVLMMVAEGQPGYIRLLKLRLRLPSFPTHSISQSKSKVNPDIKDSSLLRNTVQWSGKGCTYRDEEELGPVTETIISSVAQSCLTLCDPMDCSMSGFPVHHQLPEPTQTHVHWVSDAIQPSHPLSSPPAFNLSQHQGLFKWVSSSHQVAKGLEFQLQHQSFQWILRTYFL